jgi:diguanylate cyclase (GGDEF)-like protein/PAS domain S-box-containing protein
MAAMAAAGIGPARTFPVLLVGPVASVLVVAGSLAGGSWPHAARIAWTAGVGVACTTVLAIPRRRPGRRRRLAWAAVAVGATLTTAALVGAAAGWPEPVVWGGLRPAALVAFAVGLFATSRVRRDLREWGLLLLDGWLIGASSFALAWLGLAITARPQSPEAVLVGPGVFVPFDLVAASIWAGLVLRLPVRARAPALLVLLACVTAVAADTAWAVAAADRWGTGLWLAVLVLFAAASILGRFEMAPEQLGTTPPRVARVSQVVVVPGLLATLLAPRAGGVTVLLAASLLCALAAQILLAAREYTRLWRQLQDQADRLDAVVSESGDAILQIDERGRVEFANDAAVEVLGRAPRELTGRRIVGLVHPADRGRAVGELLHLERTGVDAVRVAARVRHADGWRDVEATARRRHGGAGYTLSTRDVSERVRLEGELRRQADTDALTGLMSRTAFLDTAADRLWEGPAAVLFLDLDGFKTINDTEGHGTGDRLLTQSARAIAGVLGPLDVAARLGGDEFAVLVPRPRPDQAAATAERLVRALGDGIISPLGARLGASVGVAIDGPLIPEGAAALLRDADLAMYEAKKRGGRRWVLFEPWMRYRVLQQTRSHVALARAVEDEALRLEVQPIVSLPGGDRVGFEALVRWEDDGELRAASDVVPFAEQTPLVVPLGAWVLRTVLGWLATWPEPGVGVAVNVAGRQLAEPGFAELVRELLAAGAVDPGRLTLDITERTAVDDVARARTVLRPLRELGVHVVLDDFGTGLSALGYLAGLPVDGLKIDRRFVAGLGVRAADDALVRAILTLARDLGLSVVAEGVETRRQAEALVAHGCELAQGLLYGPAVLIEDLAAVPSVPAGTRPSGVATDPQRA